MNNEEMKPLCNIEWRFEDGRWQVLREQIFLRPLDGRSGLGLNSLEHQVVGMGLKSALL